MAELTRFDVAAFGDVHMVVVESNILPLDPSVVVIPLIRDYPAVKGLNPVIEVQGVPFILATRLIGGVRRSALRKVGSVAGQGDDITRAVDVLMTGV